MNKASIFFALLLCLFGTPAWAETFTTVNQAPIFSSSLPFATGSSALNTSHGYFHRNCQPGYMLTATDGTGVAQPMQTVLANAPGSSGKVYWVDQSIGSDTNDGLSQTTPWKTIGKAAQTLTAGDSVIVRAGVYRETVTPKNSGSAGKLITYAAYTGDKVIVSGADTFTGWTQDVATGYWMIPWSTSLTVGTDSSSGKAPNGHNMSDRVLRGEMVIYADGSSGTKTVLFPPFQPSTSAPPGMTSTTPLQPGQFYAQVSTTDVNTASAIYARFPGDANPNTGGNSTECATRQTTFNGGGRSYLRVIGFDFRFAADVYQTGTVNFGVNCLAEENISEWNNAGGMIFSSNSTFHGNITNCNGQTGYGGGGTNTVIEYHQSNNNNWKLFGVDYGGSWGAGAGKQAHATGTVMRYCEAANNQAVGFWYDVYCSNCTLEESVAYNNWQSGVQLELSNQITLRNLVVYGTVPTGTLNTGGFGIIVDASDYAAIPTGNTTSGSTTISNLSSMAGILVGDIVTGPGIPANTTVSSLGTNSVTVNNAATSTNTNQTYNFNHPAQTTPGVTVEHCTIYGNTSYGLSINIDSRGLARNDSIYNNIFAFNGKEIQLSADNQTDLSTDHIDGNLYYHTATPGLCFTSQLKGSPARTTNTLSTWQTWVAGDAAAKLADPLLVNSADVLNGGWHLQSASPARGMGVTPPSAVPVDYDYNTRPSTGADVGADQFWLPTAATISATPSTITLGQSTTLSWSANVDMFSTVSIDQGVGVVAPAASQPFTPQSTTASGTVSVSPTTTTTYTLTVTNASGSVTSTATVTVNIPPSITTQPASQTVIVGQTATFNVVASGTAPLSYQWTKNGVNISGATSASYTTPATVAADNGAKFAVVVTNVAGSVSSNNAILTVNIPPSITTQPANQTVTLGQTATFNVVASGTAPLSYQWTKNGVNISGATSASYTTPATVAADNGAKFAVVVTNVAGSVTSSNAILTVNTPPSITTQPVNQAVNLGQTATFNVVASGTAPLSYQWTKNGVNVSGATSASYTTPATVATDNGAQFAVVVTNVAGSVTSNSATLTVKNAPPTITSQPSATPNPAMAGQSVAFSAAASDSDGDTLTFTWTFGDGASGSGASPSHTYSAAGTYSATITVTDTAGLTATASVSVTVNSVPAPVITSPTTASGTAYTPFSYTITASNTPTSYNASPLPAGLSVDAATGVISGTPTAAGTTNVTISATNAGGTGSATLVITIASGPVAYWKLDDGSGSSAADSSGNGNTGTLVNGPTWTSGQVNGALSFNGKNQYVTVPAPSGSSLDLDSAPVTIAAWINTNSITTQQAILLRGSANGISQGNQGYGMWVNSNGKINVGSAGGGNLNSNTAITAGAWHHVTGIINGTASKVYIDGVDQTPSSVNVGVVKSSLTLTIGASLNTAQTGYVGFFNGSLDDVRVYNRVLSTTEIDALASMNSTSPLALAAAQPANALLAAALTTPDATPLTITRMQASVKFNASHHDSCSVTGTIPDLPAAFNPAGQTLTLNIGGVASSFTLDAKGHGKSSQGSVSLKLKPGASTATFSVKLTRADCAGAWSLSPASDKAGWQMDLWASIDLAGNEYSTPISVKYSASKQAAKLTK
jgi:hypothetical protein